MIPSTGVWGTTSCCSLGLVRGSIRSVEATAWTRLWRSGAGTVIGIYGYNNGVEAFSGAGDTIVRDTDQTQTLDFSRTALNGIAEVDARGGHDIIVASNRSDGRYRSRTGTDTFAVKGSQGNAITISILDFNQADRDRIDLRSLSTTFGALLMG